MYSGIRAALAAGPFHFSSSGFLPLFPGRSAFQPLNAPLCCRTPEGGIPNHRFFDMLKHFM